MRGLRHFVVLGFAASAVAGCGDRGSVTFTITAPASPMLNPVAQPELVTEYDIRTASGTVIGIASAVQGSGSTGDGLLPLGALMPSAMPEDVYVTALSGGTTLGQARIKDVSIVKGKKTTYDAELRKPLVVVGSMLPAETASGNKTAPVQVIDPLSSMDLATQPATPVSLTAVTAAASTWDGRFVVVANGSALTAFDTGSGKTMSGGLMLAFAPSRLVVAPRDQAIVALDPGDGQRRVARHHQRRRRLRGRAGQREPQDRAHAGRDRAHRGLLARRQQALRADRRRRRRPVRAGRDDAGERHPDLRARRQHDHDASARGLRGRLHRRPAVGRAGGRRRGRQAGGHARPDHRARRPRCSAT